MDVPMNELFEEVEYRLSKGENVDVVTTAGEALRHSVTKEDFEEFKSKVQKDKKFEQEIAGVMGSIDDGAPSGRALTTDRRAVDQFRKAIDDETKRQEQRLYERFNRH